jgi:hypothetical protein
VHEREADAHNEYLLELAKRDEGKTAVLEGLAKNVSEGYLVPSLDKPGMWIDKE